MYEVSDAFKAAVVGSHQAISRVQVWREDIYMQDIEFIAGSVTFDASRSYRSSCTLALSAENLVPEEVGDLLYPIGTEIRPARGVRLAGGSDEYVPLGVFGYSEVELDEGSRGLVITITGNDRAEVFDRTLFMEPFKVDKGTTAADAIANIYEVSGVLGEFNNLTSSTPALPLIVFQPGASPWAAVQSIAKAAGVQVYFDRIGNLTVSDIPNPAYVLPDAVYDTEDTTTPNTVLSLARNLSTANTYNGAVAMGEGTDLVRPLRAEIWDTDPGSPFRKDGPFGRKPLFFSSPMILTSRGAAKAASAMLSRVLGATESIEWTSIVDPALDVYDIITMSRDKVGVHANFMVDSLTIPLEASQVMRATGRTNIYSPFEEA